MSFTCLDNNIIDVAGLCDGSSIDLTTYKYWTEISIPQMVTVPEEKPDIEMVNAVNASTKIIRKKVIVTPDSVTVKNEEGRLVTGRKLIVEGVVCLAVEYTGLVPQQSVHTAHFNVPFSAYIVIPKEILIGGVLVDTLDVNFEVVPCIEDVFVKDFNLREIFVNITLFLQAIPVAKACPEEECNCDEKDVEIIVKGVCPENKIANLLADGNTTWTEIFIPELLNIPSQKPDIEELLSVSSKIEILSQRVVETPSSTSPNAENTFVTGRKLIIEGILKQQIIYTADVPEQSVHSAHFNVPFSAFIILPEDAIISSSQYKIDACIEDIFMCALNSRQIFKNVTIFLKATVRALP